MPLRLLGLMAGPEDAARICGRSFLRYAEQGAEVTLACAADPPAAATLRVSARQLGVRGLVLLDHQPAELEPSALTGIFADLIRSLAPHVVVADGEHPAIAAAASAAFALARKAAGGTAALPAKLYYRAPQDATPIAATTMVKVWSAEASAGAEIEFFVRAFPNPWVTGVLERDLFAGIDVDAAAPPTVERLAS